VPFGLAMKFAFVKELIARMLMRREPPTITRFIVYLVGRRTQYDISKARRELCWRPQVNIQEGVRRSLVWFQAAAPGVVPEMKVPVLTTK
jgi:nucleoside-diphosphate-sugar epimerase